jgi:hypothetical protein
MTLIKKGKWKEVSWSIIYAHVTSVVNVLTIDDQVRRKVSVVYMCKCRRVRKTGENTTYRRRGPNKMPLGLARGPCEEERAELQIRDVN